MLCTARSFSSRTKEEKRRSYSSLLFADRTTKSFLPIHVSQHEWNIRSQQVVHFVTQRRLTKQLRPPDNKVPNSHVEISVTRRPVWNAREGVSDQKFLGYWVDERHALLVDCNQQVLWVRWVRCLLDFKERWSKCRPPEDHLEEGNLGVFWRHSGVLAVGSHYAFLPLHCTEGLDQVVGYKFSQHLPKASKKINN